MVTAFCLASRLEIGQENNPGGLAQLGERLHGMQEVIGSSPLSSIFLTLLSHPSWERIQPSNSRPNP